MAAQAAICRSRSPHNTNPIAERSRNTTPAKSTSSHAQHHTAKITTTTTATPPARAPSIPQQRGRHQHFPPRNRSNTRLLPARAARLLKHENARPASKRTFDHTPPPTGASLPWSSSPAPSRSPTQAHKAAITKFKHHNKRRDDNNTRRGQRSTTEVRVVVVVFVVVWRCQHRNLRTLTDC
jgi:hypothetical protein